MSDPNSASGENKKNTTFRVIRFAFFLSLVCSLLITAAASGLKRFQEENMILDKKVNILKAANILEDKKPPKEEINRLYKTRIREVLVDDSGRILDTVSLEEDPQGLHVYLYLTGDSIDGYIIPINTRGLWGKIQGYLAFENDGETVSGFSVFSHSETPGLGGEIESRWFSDNFKGKKILNSENKFVSVGIAKGEAKNLPPDLQEHYVDGISGATLTGKFLSQGIRSTLERYEALSVTFRQKKMKAIKKKISRNGE
ncbi:FMN-binding protein [Desulfospira joergensenii]|uniref:FMN-binding protein n=1 Tax=Desulfospira joergensenii TaxID=53329 RepID=UPI0003B32E72|nr:FMN-binding protein [Desulfospira joergensenii]